MSRVRERSSETNEFHWIDWIVIIPDIRHVSSDISISTYHNSVINHNLHNMSGVGIVTMGLHIFRTLRESDKSYYNQLGCTSSYEKRIWTILRYAIMIWQFDSYLW